MTRISMSADGFTVDGLDFTTEAKIIYALVMRLGGTVRLSADETAVTRENAGFVIEDVDGGGYAVTAGPWPTPPQKAKAATDPRGPWDCHCCGTLNFDWAKPCSNTNCRAERLRTMEEIMAGNRR